MEIKKDINKRIQEDTFAPLSPINLPNSMHIIKLNNGKRITNKYIFLKGGIYTKVNQ